VIAQYSSTSHPRLIGNDDILSLFADRKGYLWAGSSNGIFSLQPVTSDSVRATGLIVESDLSSTSIHTIQPDNAGNLWATTNQGLSLIGIGRKNVRSFNANDGLINFEYSDGASYFDRNTGRLYVGGTMGVDIIQTDSIQFSSYFPPVAINQLLIRNLAVEIGDESVLSSRINHQSRLELRYNQNAVSFDVTALTFWGKERHKISYRLLNSDDNWVVNTKNQAIGFTNLEPGRYKLQFRVSDENGNWSDQIREIEIIINPPFWRTTWAILGYILLFLMVQFFIFSAFRRKKKKKKQYNCPIPETFRNPAGSSSRFST